MIPLVRAENRRGRSCVLVGAGSPVFAQQAGELRSMDYDWSGGWNFSGRDRVEKVVRGSFVVLFAAIRLSRIFFSMSSLPMKRRILVSAVLGVLALSGGWILGGSHASAAEIGWIEDYSLATDRTVPLKQLIPGSEDYYFYTCLHYQALEQWDQVDATLKAWIDRYRDTPRIREIQNREALLTYKTNPAADAGADSRAAQFAVQPSARAA